jgi:hypothetical protein
VRHDRATAARPNPSHRIGKRGPLVRDVGRLSGDEIPVEHRLHIARDALSHEEARKVGPANQVRVTGI